MTETIKPTTERTAASTNGFRTIGTGAPAAVSEPVGTDDRAVIGVFDDIDAAQAAVERLAAAGFPIDRISIVSKDLQSETRVNGYVTTGDIAGPAAAPGAWVGGLFGLMAGRMSCHCGSLGTVRRSLSSAGPMRRRCATSRRSRERW